MLRIFSAKYLLVCSVIFMYSCKKDKVLDNPTTVDQKTVLLGDHHDRRKRCNTDQKMQTIYQDNPSMLDDIKQGRAMVQQNMRKANARSTAVEALLTIPIHFIIVHSPGESIGSGDNISNERIHSQLEVLNLDFLRRNTDAANTPSIFPAVGSQIQFCMANVDPAGNATNGISRYATTQNFDQNELSIKSATTWNPAEYLNVWVAPDIDGLGYAYLPSISSRPAEDEDGAVILTAAFGGPGSGAEAPFDLGRTLTHEVGHYLGLDHIWGEGCSIDDGIDDTPDQEEENTGCRSHPSPSCSNQGDMFMNYMDYSDDHCLNAFTAGQANYMRQILQTSRAALVTPGRTSCSGDSLDPIGPTCDDGIMNGSETGIDCGGLDCVPCGTTQPIDAGISNLQISANTGNCISDVEITVVLQNFSNQPLSSAILELRSGDLLVKKTNWSGSLGKGESAIVSVGLVNLPIGEHDISVVSINPNGQMDTNKSNDTVRTIYKSTEGTLLHLTIQPDDYGSEITWKIKNENGEVVGSGGGYKDFNYNLIEERFCLRDGCYRLIVRDSYGDGICCDYGEGYYMLEGSSGASLVESDGYYGYRETTWFCIENQSFGRQRSEREARSNLPLKTKEVSKRPEFSRN